MACYHGARERRSSGRDCVHSVIGGAAGVPGAVHFVVDDLSLPLSSGQLPGEH